MSKLNEKLIKNTLHQTVKRPFFQMLEICNSKDTDKNKVKAMKVFCNTVLKAVNSVK